MSKITNKELTDQGICPTCYDREHNHIVFGDNSDKMLYEDKDLECFLCPNPRAKGHTIISTKKHYKDMLELPDKLCSKIYVFAKRVMIILKNEYQAESVYLCTMCDGPMNHFHVQLIPRYKEEKRGSRNFVKERKEYAEDKEKINNLRKRLNWYPTIELKQLKRVDNIDLDEYIKFREQVKNNMSNPDWLGDFEKKDLKQLLKEGAKIWIYYLNKTPICSMMCLPTEKDFLENLDIEYDEDSIVDYGPMFVNYDYIGSNLQYQMLKELDKLSKENGYQYAITTVHPDNIYSSNNLKLDKFHCFRTKSLPRGIREIYIKKL